MAYIVIIPIYKVQPSDNEILSLLQCFQVLKKHDVVLCCPEPLDTSEYNKAIGKNIRTERFLEYYFQGIDGYNKLMTSCEFYSRFKDYEYMLIYQLDAYVFTDQLDKWCSKGYDYIGAPWFKEHKEHQEGYDDLWGCGNGGFSLRKIDKFIKITSPTTKCYSTKYIIKHFFHTYKTWGKGIIRLLGINNNMAYYRKRHSHLWEDVYFCYGLDNTSQCLHRPKAEEAALFSFEKSPQYLYKLTCNTLPFGCHAWEKYQYKEFWKSFIPTSQNKQQENEIKHYNHNI